MKGIAHHINKIKEKPHHVRRRIAYAISGGLAALIAIIWVGVSLSAGAFAIHGSTFAEVAGTEVTPPAPGESVQTAALAASAASLQKTETSAHIEIINAPASSSPSTTTPLSQGTIIPF